MAGIRVEGGARLRRTLRAAGDDLSDLRDAHAQSAQIAATAGAALAPVRSGALAASVRSSGTKTAGTIRAGRASVPYAGVIHWGWPDRNIEANTFLTDGAQSSESTWIPVFEKQLNESLNKVKGV